MKNFVKSRYAIALFLFLIFGGETIAMGLNNSTENLFNAQNSPATNFNMMTPKNSLSSGDSIVPQNQAIITGDHLTIVNGYAKLVFNGPELVSMLMDGNGTNNYGVDWLYSQEGAFSGYQWFLQGDSNALTPNPSVKWVNLSTSNTDGGEYQLNYVLGGVINATFIVTLNSSSITFDYAFLTLQNLVAEKYGWMWVFNQTTEGYTPEIVDMMWGYQNGVGYNAMGMQENKRVAFNDIWGPMDSYFLQGTEAANAAFSFTPPVQEQSSTFLNESDHLGFVTWPYNEETDGSPQSVSSGTMFDRNFTINIQPVANWEQNGPSDYPRFIINTTTTIGPDNMSYGAALTRYLWERTFSWPVQQTGTWVDWDTTMFAWENPIDLQQCLDAITSIPISNAGHPASWGTLDGWPFPDNDSDMNNVNPYDTRHSDTYAFYISAIWRLWEWTGNDTWLQQVQPLLNEVANAMTSMILTSSEVDNASFVANIPEATGAVPLPKSAVGLFFYDWVGHNGASGGLGSNYWDISPFGWLDAYVNPLVYDALLSLNEIETALGNLTLAAQYQAMANQLRIAYSATFWDNVYGRFIGCIDAWGIKHDYGFTYVNQQAAYAGLEWGQPLVNASQVNLMYHWMVDEPTGSGSADTFTKWIYAARANTEINNDQILNSTLNQGWWAGNGTADNDSNQWPWSGLNGQLQNGGCSVYTSYLDMVARNYFLGSDNAEERLREILDRFALPDHMSGGSPLYLGEIPQQASSGSVGTDYPFPESGMLPAMMIFGILGATPQWQAADSEAGLPAGHVVVLNPSLPTSWHGFTIQNVLFDNMVINITVSDSFIQVDFPISVLADPTLQIEVNGTRYLISAIVDANGVVQIAYDSHQAEKLQQWNLANQDYNDQLASGEFLNLDGTNGLNLVPAITDPNLIPDLATWWGQTILLMSNDTRTGLLSEMNTLNAATSVAMPGGVEAQVVYKALMLYRQDAQNSYNQGDLRWTVGHYQQAEVLALRMATVIQQTLPTVAMQFVAIPFFIGLVIIVTVYTQRKQKKMPSTIKPEVEY